MLIGERESEHRDNECLLRRPGQGVGDFVIVSQAVLLGYPQLSDGAKITYWVIYSHDWYEPARRGRKGYVFPTVRRLAELRHTTPRTVQRHLAELIGVGLLTRVIRRGKPSILYIEEPAQGEASRHQHEQREGGDIAVGGGVTILSPQQEDETRQTKPINGVEELVMEEGRRTAKDFQPIRALLNPNRFPRLPVKPDLWLANQIVAETGDARSLGCYRVVAQRCPQALVFEALSLLKEARRDGSIRRSRGALFVGIVRRLCRERGLPEPFGSEGRTVKQSHPTGQGVLRVGTWWHCHRAPGPP